jgi:hypothetical protein
MLDGRNFTCPGSARFTADQEDYVLGHLRLAGAVEIIHDLDGVNRTEEKRAEDLLTHILLSGRSQHILAGCLTEEGKTWSRREADANAARFAAITDVSEKTEMQKLIVTFVVELFIVRETLSDVSRKSSRRSTDVPPKPNADLSIN